MSPFIFKVPPIGFTETQELIASTGIANDRFGYSVAIDGNVAVVGVNTNAEAAYIYERSGNVWNEVQKITASDGLAGEKFGFTVAVSGTTVVVGARWHTEAGISSAGAVYVFEKGGSWPATETAKLIASDKAVSDNFGWSVGIEGTTVVVGAITVESNAGAVYVFEKGGSWPATETAKLIASDPVVGDEYLGSSVGISGNVIVAGARFADIGGNSNQGSVYVFEKSGTWPATETAKLIASDGLGGDNFGWSVGIEGTTVVVGAPLKNQGAISNQGSAYVFEKSGTWPATETQMLLASDGFASNNFGSSVGISGNVIVVGAPRTTNSSAYIFRKAGSWPSTENKRILPIDNAVADEFGVSVAISGTTIISGAENHDTGGNNNQGSAYIFDE